MSTLTELWDTTSDWDAGTYSQTKSSNGSVVLQKNTNPSTSQNETFTVTLDWDNSGDAPDSADATWEIRDQSSGTVLASDTVTGVTTDQSWSPTIDIHAHYDLEFYASVTANSTRSVEKSNLSITDFNSTTVLSVTDSGGDSGSATTKTTTNSYTEELPTYSTGSHTTELRDYGSSDVTVNRLVADVTFNSGDGDAISATVETQSGTTKQLSLSSGQNTYNFSLASDDQYQVTSDISHGATETASPSVNSLELVAHAPPTGLQIAGTRETEVDLSWDASGVVNESGYEILQAEASGSTAGDYSVVASVSADTSTATVTGLEAGETYYYRVRATYSTGVSDLSGEVSTTTALSAPSFDTIETNDADDIVLEFTPQDNSSDGSIEIYRSTSQGSLGSQIATVDDDATSYTDTTADVTQVYWYTLRRVTDHTDSDSQQWSTILPPDGLSLDDSTYETRVILSWTDSATTEDGYKVWYSIDGGSTWTLDADLSAGTTSYETSDLVPNKAHTGAIQIKLEAYKDQDSDGSGDTTDEEVQTASLSTLTLTGPYTLGLRLDGSLGQLSGDDCRSVLATLKPTTQSQWEYQTEYLPSLEDWAFSEIFLYAQRQDGGFALIMRGQLDQARSLKRNGSLSGHLKRVDGHCLDSGRCTVRRAKRPVGASAVVFHPGGPVA